MKILTLTFLLFTGLNMAVGQNIFNAKSIDQFTLTKEDQNLFLKIEPTLRADFVKIVEITPLSEFEDITRIIIKLPLLSVTEEFNLKYIHSPSNKQHFWYGETKDNNNSFELLFLDGAYSGGFSVGSDYFEINPLTQNRVIISRTKMDNKGLSEYPHSEEARTEKSKVKESVNNSQSGNRSSCPDPDDIRILVFYTPNVKNTYTTRQINAKAFTGVANLNAAVSNSGGNSNDAYFKMATAQPVELTGFVEHHDQIGNDLEEFKNRVATFIGPGYTGNLRNAVGADLCVLLTECTYSDGGGQFLGLSRVPTTSSGDDQRAFSIVDFFSATIGHRRTFTHEVSHLFGGDHLSKDIAGSFTQNLAKAINPCNPCATGPFQTSFTYPSATAQYFGNSASLYVFKQLRFSREGTTLSNGSAYGTSDRDNFEQITDRAPIVRNYRTYNPYSVEIQGIDFVYENTNHTWTSFICGCSSSKNYSWERSEDGLNFYPVSSSATYTGMVTNDSDMYLRLTVSCGGQSETDLLYILNMDNGNCTQCKPITDNPNVDLKNTFLAQKTTIYPNPPNNILNIDFTEDVQGPIFLRIISQTGNKIMQKSFNNDISNRVSISTKSLDAGLYYLVISTTSEIETKSFIITR
jgi:hypothetical protein